MIDIFLSYTERDRDAAIRVVDLLESAGWTVWWDRRIPAGETWRNVLERALGEMRCMIVLWSNNSISSEWVYEEASEGRRQGKLVPVLIEAVRPPAGFREIQAADLSAWDGSPGFNAARLLVADLEHMIGKPVASRVETQQTPDAVKESRLRGKTSAVRWPQTWPRRSFVWVPAAVLVTAAAYFFAPAVYDRISEIRSDQKPLPVAATPPPKTTTSAHPDLGRSAALRNQDEADARPLRAASGSPRTARASARCTDLLTRMQLGETLSEEAQNEFRRECRQ
jgi:hypothetical protein